jgi:hypothetical protein
LNAQLAPTRSVFIAVTRFNATHCAALILGLARRLYIPKLRQEHGTLTFR